MVCYLLSFFGAWRECRSPLCIRFVPARFTMNGFSAPASGHGRCRGLLLFLCILTALCPLETGAAPVPGYRRNWEERENSQGPRHNTWAQQYEGGRPAKTPEEREKYVHEYYGSPPKPFNRKGEWHGTVHYDWGYYKGPWLNGRWHTKEGEVGECHHFDDERTYVGGFWHHKMHGKGEMTYPDGHKVTGEWEKVYSWQVFMGHGTVQWTDGRIWTGPWANGQPHGEGTLRYPDAHGGDVVHGHFEHGHCKECEDQHRAHYKHKKKKKYHHVHMNLHGDMNEL